MTVRVPQLRYEQNGIRIVTYQENSEAQIYDGGYFPYSGGYLPNIPLYIQQAWNTSGLSALQIGQLNAEQAAIIALQDYYGSNVLQKNTRFGAITQYQPGS